MLLPVHLGTRETSTLWCFSLGLFFFFLNTRVFVCCFLGFSCTPKVSRCPTICMVFPVWGITQGFWDWVWWTDLGFLPVLQRKQSSTCIF